MFTIVLTMTSLLRGMIGDVTLTRWGVIEPLGGHYAYLSNGLNNVINTIIYRGVGVGGLYEMNLIICTFGGLASGLFFVPYERRGHVSIRFLYHMTFSPLWGKGNGGGRLVGMGRDGNCSCGYISVEGVRGWVLRCVPLLSIRDVVGLFLLGCCAGCARGIGRLQGL